MRMNRLSSGLRLVGILWVLMTGVLLQGCGGGGSSTPAPPPGIDAGVGYFDSLSGGGGQIYSDTSKTTLATISDLQAIVKGDQLMLVSVTENVAWFAKLTTFSNGSYSADVNIYKDNNPLGKATLTGTITSGTSMTGTLTGAGIAYGNGTFSLDISAENSTKANVATIVRMNPSIWTNVKAVSASNFYIDASGNITNNKDPFVITNGNFYGCQITGTVSAVANSALFQFQITVSCGPSVNPLTNGTYTGFAVTRSASTANDTLVVVLENSANGYSMYGEFQ